MAETYDLGPLTLCREGQVCLFRLTAPEEIRLELPKDYDERLSAQLAESIDLDAPLQFVFDLENVPAISSRHLGLMLALHKALRRVVDPLPVRGASASVQRLLSLTRTSPFFCFE